jgi:hypothetical protein
VANAGVERPALGDAPRALQVLVEVRDVVVLVAPQAPLHALRRPDEVLVALAVLGQRVVRDPADQREGAVADARLQGPAQIGAGVVAAEHDHAARMQRARLRRERDRLELLGVAMPAVEEGADRLRVVEASFVDDADLRLVDGLARVEGECRRIDAARVGFELRARQAERVLRFRQRDAVDDQRQLARFIRVPGELGIAEAAVGLAVVAVAVGREPARADQVTQRSARAAGLDAEAHGVVASAGQTGGQARRRHAFFGEDLDHTARRVAVQRRERSAQHFDAFRGTEIDVRELTLTIRQRGRDAVDVEANAPDAEGRSCAEAAHRDLDVLGVVLTVARQQARHSAEALGQIDLQPGVADAGAVDPVDRRRHVERQHVGARRGDDDRREPRRRFAADCLSEAQTRQRGCAERRECPSEQMVGHRLWGGAGHVEAACRRRRRTRIRPSRALFSGAAARV